MRCTRPGQFANLHFACLALLNVADDDAERAMGEYRQNLLRAPRDEHAAVVTALLEECLEPSFVHVTEGRLGLGLAWDVC